MTRRRSTETGEPLCPAWPLVVGLLAVAFVVFFVAERGAWVPDNRLIQFLNPRRGLSLATTTWSSNETLGRMPGYQGIVVWSYSALLDGLGAAPWLIQRVFHATLVAGGAVGAALVAREFVGRTLLGPAVAGLWWIAAPFTSAFLLPSWLYVNAAVLPWLFLAWLRGTTTTSRWRWAGCFALAVAVAGFLNLPGLVLAALPLLLLVPYLIWTGQSSWRASAWFLARVAVLVAPVISFDLYRSRLLSAWYDVNLSTSETAESVGRSASWSESLRGLGNWLTYWNPTGPPLKLWLLPLLERPAVILASFAPVVAAACVVTLSRWRPRLLFGAILVLATTVMVGLHPIESPSPIGRVLSATYDSLPWTFSLRNGYKAGAGWLLATAVLLGYAAAWLSGAVPRRWAALRSLPRVGSPGTRWRVLGAATAVGALAVTTASPIWTGEIYSRPDTLEAVPDYWIEAFDWLESQELDTRTMVLPSVADVYRWGSATDGDIFGSLLASPFVLDAPLAQPAAVTADAIRAQSERISSGNHAPGTFAEIARRLGIGHVIVRNDTRWELFGVVRPAYLDSLRADPGLNLVATFGDAGQNVVGEGDTDVAAFRELELAPVEVYEVVDGPDDPVRAVAGPSLLVSGDATSWATLAAAGALAGSGPIRYTADLSLHELRGELSQGAPLVVSDTNRRQSTEGLGRGGSKLGYTGALFGRPGSQSVTSYGDAASITSLSAPSFFDLGPPFRPAAAFDGSAQSAFMTGVLAPLTPANGLRVDLREPASIGSIAFDAVRTPGLRDVTGVELLLSTGLEVPVELDEEGLGEATFAPQEVTWFEVRVTELEGVGTGAWGFDEIDVPGLDLVERIEVPDDVIRVAELDPATEELLVAAPTTFQFERLVRGSQAVESSLQRRFRVPADREFMGYGVVQATPQVSDEQLASLLDLAQYASSPSRLDGSLAGSALMALDGREDTSWGFDAAQPGELRVTMPPQTGSAVEVVLDVGLLDAVGFAVQVSAGGETRTVRRALPTRCQPGAPCRVAVTVPFGTGAADAALVEGLDVTVQATSPAGEPGSISVLEVLVDRTANPALPDVIPETCEEGMAKLDGAALGVKLFALTASLFTGAPIAIDACSPVTLTEGWHELGSGDAVPFSTFRFTAGDAPDAAAAPSVTVEERADTHMRATVEAGEGTSLITGQAPSTLWRAEVGGEDLGPPIVLDAQMAWPLPAGGRTDVELSVPAQRTSDLLLYVMLAGLGVCVALVVVGPRSRRPSVPVDAQPREARPWMPADLILLWTAAVVAAGAIAGLGGAVLAAAVVALSKWRLVERRMIGAVTVALIVLAALATIPPLGPELGMINPEWPNDRSLAWHAARIAAVMLVASITLSVSALGRRPPGLTAPDEPARDTIAGWPDRGGGDGE